MYTLYMYIIVKSLWCGGWFGAREWAGAGGGGGGGGYIPSRVYKQLTFYLCSN